MKAAARKIDEANENKLSQAEQSEVERGQHIIV